MPFPSFGFLLFFPCVFLCHWSLAGRSARAQNVLLLLASLVFYGLADARALPLLFVCALVNYAAAIGLVTIVKESTRSVLFWSGIVFNIGLLAVFKYFGFFLTGVASLLHGGGGGPADGALPILLPLGLSFLTFQMVGYLIEVNNGDLEPERSPLAFLTYVFYFPKILAGPVERAQHFLPRVAVRRSFDPSLVADGFRQVLWGFFAKVVIADNADAWLDPVFDGSGTRAGSTFLLAACMYIIQLYADFSGYSNIAIGISKMLGIPLASNFAMPLFATNVSEFWKRWHMSLTGWMMDYVFTPLSFLLRGLGRWGTVVSISVVFLTVGIWHGANWAFVLFGALQSLLFLPMAFANALNRPTVFPDRTLLPTGKHLLRMMATFLPMMLCFVLLRTEDVGGWFRVVHGMFSTTLFGLPGQTPWPLLGMIAIYLLFEWWQRSEEYALRFKHTALPATVRGAICYIVAFTALWYGGAHQTFIYFQF